MKQINKEEIKTKLNQAKWRVNGKVHEVKVWAEQNPEMAALIVSGTITAAAYVGKIAIKDFRNYKDAVQLRRRCYDPSKGHYYYLKRDLTNKEWLMIDRRRDAGEKLPDILEEMRVLK